MYYSIYYKNMKIDWVTNEFFEPEASKIINKIVKKTVSAKILSYGNLLCTQKEDLDTIYRILTDEYNRIKKQKEVESGALPNLILESIHQLILPPEID